MKIGIGNDHAATEMKMQIVSYLQEKGIEVVNYGTDGFESFPYPVSAIRAFTIPSYKFEGLQCIGQP